VTQSLWLASISRTHSSIYHQSVVSFEKPSKDSFEEATQWLRVSDWRLFHELTLRSTTKVFIHLKKPLKNSFEDATQWLRVSDWRLFHELTLRSTNKVFFYLKKPPRNSFEEATHWLRVSDWCPLTNSLFYLPPRCSSIWKSHSKTHLRMPLSDSESLIGVHFTNSLFDLPPKCPSIWKRRSKTHLKKWLSDSVSLIGVYFTNSLFDLPPKCSASWKRLWVVMSYLWMCKLFMICTWRIQFVMFWRLIGFVKFPCLNVIPMNVQVVHDMYMTYSVRDVLTSHWVREIFMSQCHTYECVMSPASCHMRHATREYVRGFFEWVWAQRSGSKTRIIRWQRPKRCVMSPESLCVASSNESEFKWMAQRLEL